VGTVPGVDRLSTTTLEPLVAQKYLSAGARDAILGSFHQGSMVTFVNDDTLTFIGQIRPRGAPDYALYITANGIFFRNASNQMEHI
jgi:hypothetical protein